MAPPWHIRVTSLQDVEELWDSDVATEIPATWPRTGGVVYGRFTLW